jgi:hypothetical protein
MLPQNNSASRFTGSLISILLISLCVAACGQTVVRPFNRPLHSDLPRPSRIAIGDFSTNHAAVIEYQGIFRQQPTNRNPLERQRLLASAVSETLSTELISKLKQLGFVAERAPLAIAPDHDVITIEGEVIRIDEGNPLRRFVIGLGSGAATVQTRLTVYQGTQRVKLLEFVTDAESGKLPGAAITFAAGSAVPPLTNAGLITANAVARGLQSSPDVNSLARSSAARAAQVLSEYFVMQNWIRPDQAKKIRAGY